MIWLLAVWLIILTFGFVVIRGAPYVPSKKKYIKRAFTKLYPVSKKDVLVDIGSGDGVVLRQASRLGAKAIGYEINPILVVISRFLSRRDKNITIRLTDFWLKNLPDDTTIVYTFTASPYVKKIAAKLANEATRLGRPLRFIIYGNALHGHKADGKLDGYRLYTFQPLQIDKP